MNSNCVLFAAVHLKPEEIAGKRVLEAGSSNVNGSLRPLIESYHPAAYLGVDLVSGPGVDRICDVTRLIDTFGENSFDVVISTELIEHVRDWRAAIHHLKGVCRPGGTILITTRSRGFPYHGYPADFWRYEAGDMAALFRDCRIEKIEPDPEKGVFLKAVKPDPFSECALAGHELFSVVTGRTMKEVADADLRAWPFRMMTIRLRLADRIVSFVKKILCRS